MMLNDLENLNRRLTSRYLDLQDIHEALKNEVRWREKKNNGLVGFKGTDQYDVGYVYCPYVPGLRFARV